MKVTATKKERFPSEPKEQPTIPHPAEVLEQPVVINEEEAKTKKVKPTKKKYSSWSRYFNFCYNDVHVGIASAGSGFDARASAVPAIRLVFAIRKGIFPVE